MPDQFHACVRFPHCAIAELNVTLSEADLKGNPSLRDPTLNSELKFKKYAILARHQELPLTPPSPPSSPSPAPSPPQFTSWTMIRTRTKPRISIRIRIRIRNKDQAKDKVKNKDKDAKR